MNTDRFKNYEEDIKQLVLEFESMDLTGSRRYYDVDELETIIDFYLNNADGEMLEKSVRYGERLFPTSNEIRLRRVHLLCFKERYDEALHILKELEQIEPDNTDVLYALGVVHSALEHSRKSIQYFLKAAEDGYELAMIYGNIADEYVKMGQLADARSFYRKALRLNADDERSLYELANCYEDDGLNEKWIAYFRRFVEDNPYSRGGWFCLGEAYLSTQLYEKAVDAYQYAITVDEDYYDAYMQLSASHYALGDYNKAVSTLHDAIDHTEDKALVYFRIGEIFKQTNNLTTANVYYRKAVSEDPYYGEAWHALSLSYSMSGDFPAAIDAAKRALKIDTESPLLLTTLALIYADSGDLDNADRIFECAMPYYADFEQGWLAYADYLIVQNRIDEAVEILTKELPDCEMVTEFNKRLALCYYHLGRRNMLYNVVRACIYDENDGERQLLEFCPELRNDPQVMDIIISHRNENNDTSNNHHETNSQN